MDAIFVTGTAGSGKSLLTSALKEWYLRKAENAITVNLDPGVVDLPYAPDVDVREKLDLLDIMTTYKLGPNGALILASDMVATKVAEIQDEIDSLGPEYVIVDTPGQLELFVFRESGPYIVKQLAAESKTLLFLIDPQLANTPANFLSLGLLAASVGLRMRVPRISLLTKRDLVPEMSRQIMEWSKNASLFADRLAETKSGEEYALYSELFRSLRKLAFGMDLYPVSSVTSDGFVALVGEMARLGRGGEEVTD